LGGRAGQGCVLAGGLARGIYLVQPRHGSGRGTAAPRSVARQELPRQRSPKPVVATSDLCRTTMHDATQVFGRDRAKDAAKSFSFKKKTCSVRFKNSYQKVLKLKKILEKRGGTNKYKYVYISFVLCGALKFYCPSFCKCMG